MTSQTLVGKAVLVTGGARRIGREIALELASGGADVTITYRNSKDEAEQTVQLIKQLGSLAIALECDVRSEQSVRSAISASVSFHGHLDVLVNNAAILRICSARRDQPRSVGRSLRDQCAWTFSRRPRGSAASARVSWPHHQHRLTRRIARLGRPCPLLRIEGRPPHAYRGHGQILRT